MCICKERPGFAVTGRDAAGEYGSERPAERDFPY